MILIICRGQNGEDEVESTSLGPGDMPTGEFLTLLQRNIAKNIENWGVFVIFNWKFSDRILEAEKICDKQEMEQFPNEGDDIQVSDIYRIYIYDFTEYTEIQVTHF